MCIRDSEEGDEDNNDFDENSDDSERKDDFDISEYIQDDEPVSYTHLRAHETVLDLVCRLLLEKKNNNTTQKYIRKHNNQKKHAPYQTYAYHIDRNIKYQYNASRT